MKKAAFLNFISLSLFIGALLLFVALVTCGGGGMGGVTDIRGQKTIMTIMQADNGKKISLKLGEEIRIELEELGSAGYGWYVDNLDKEHLELVSKQTKVISEGKVGTPVMAVWLFKAKKKGSSGVKMDYYRVWEGKDKATEQFSIKLTIE